MFDYINYDSDLTSSRLLSMVMIQMMINISDGRDDADLHIMVQLIHTK